MKPIRIFLAIAIAAISLSSTATNPRIDKVIKELEKTKNVELTFTEKRDPETHEVTYSSYLIKFDNESKAKELTELFEKERSNSIEANKSSNAYSLTFIADGIKSTYVLMKGPKIWSLTVNKVQTAQNNNQSKSLKGRVKYRGKRTQNDVGVYSTDCPVDNSVNLNAEVLASCDEALAAVESVVADTEMYARSVEEYGNNLRLQIQQQLRDLNVPEVSAAVNQ